MILKALVEKPDASEKELIKTLGVDPDRVGANLLQLQKEGLVTKRDKRFLIA
jgi:DNA-binding MarR family transcriptional regulator